MPRLAPPTTVSRRRFLRAAAATAWPAFLLPSAAARVALDAATATARLPARRGFSFLHTYESTGRYWAAIERAGLVRDTTGIRLVNSPWGPDEARFNHVARLGGPLHALLRRRRCQFLVDRVAGGSVYRDYPFDRALIHAYERLLGDRFLGGQIHEPVCNTRNDWERLRAANPARPDAPVDPEPLRAYFDGSNEKRWLEFGSLADYAGRTAPADPATFWTEVERAVRLQASRFAGAFSTCEGNHFDDLGWHIGYRLGARSVIAETGVSASSLNPFAIAAIRGAARAAGRSWGVFFAPWGPGGCTSFLSEADWSWRCPRGEMEASGWPIGPERGPSTALQRRVFFHAYLSGAHTLHEEWGAETNLGDLDSAGLSSYGRVTRALLDFQSAHPDVGRPHTPLALVLDAGARPPERGPWRELKWALRRLTDADRACAARPDGGEPESKVYPPWAVPEVFDIVPSDAPTRVWRGYRRVLALSGTPAPPVAERVAPDQWIDAVPKAARDLAPIVSSSGLPLQVNFRPSDRAWIIGLYNPWGARRGDVFGLGSLLAPACARQDVLRPRFPVRSVRVLHAWPEGTRASLVADAIEAEVGPGGTLVLEIHPSA